MHYKIRSRDLCMTVVVFFFFNDTATTEIYTLSLHDALPIYDVCRESARRAGGWRVERRRRRRRRRGAERRRPVRDRKSTRLNSSHQIISYAVFCLKKKKLTNCTPLRRTTQRAQQRAIHSQLR